MDFNKKKEEFYRNYISNKLKTDSMFITKFIKITNEINKLTMAFNKLNLGESIPDYEKLSFRERAYVCHLLPGLFAYDELVSGRQMWWQNILKEPGLLSPNKQIPQINFLSSPNDITMAMLDNCLSYPKYDRYQMMVYLLDYLLYGFGDSSIENLDHIPDDALEYLYRNFDVFFMIIHPYDYFGDILSDTKGKIDKQGTGFFPTPMHVVDCMVRMTFQDTEGIYSSVCDPCVGTGRMLLCSSNKSINLYGTDIDRIVYKACLVNMHLYCPFAVRLTEEIKDKINYRNKYRRDAV